MNTLQEDLEAQQQWLTNPIGFYGTKEPTMTDDQHKSEHMPDEDPDAYLKDCVQIEPLAIQEEYVRLPADLAYWNAQYAMAQKEQLHAKVDLDILERELYPVIRGELEAAGKVTEKMIEAGVGQSEVWQDAKKRLADAEAEKLRLYGVLDAVRTKRDMLISLGAHLRVEMQGDPTLRDQSRDFGKMG